MEKVVLKNEQEIQETFNKFNWKEFSIDTETTSLLYTELELTGISLCDGTINAYVPVGQSFSPPYKVVSLIQSHLALLSSKPKVVMHNAVFDLKVLHKYGFDAHTIKLFDTMVAHHLLDENDKHGLKYLTRTILERDVDDFDKGLSHYDNKFFEYALDDSLNTWLLYQKFLPKIINKDLEKLFFKIEMPFQLVLLEMAIEGVVINVDLLKKQQKILEEEILKLTTQLHDLLGAPYSMQLDLKGGFKIVSKINFNSSQQLVKIFQERGLEITETTPSGNPSVGKVTLKAHNDDEFVATLTKYKVATKLYDAFVSPDGQLIQNLEKDGRVRPNFRDTGTKTGRLSCLAEGTKIQTVRDFSKEPEGKNIEDIKPGDWVYVSDKYGMLTTRKVKRLINNGKQECIRLKWMSLSNKFNGELVCTPDHKIKTLDGKWTRADEVRLTSNSEIGYKRRMGEDLPKTSRAYSLHFQLYDYAFIYYPGMKKVKNIRYLMNAEKGQHVHHKDFNKRNDNYYNLQLLSSKEHCSLHIVGNGLQNTETQRKAQETLKGMRERGEINYGRELTRWSKDYCEYLAHKHKGMIKYIIKDEHHDFETIHREMKRNDVNLKEIKKLYEETNHYFIDREDAGVQQVYDLEIDTDDMYDTHNFFANEICVHNCTKPNLQQLPKPGEYSPVNVREVITVPDGYVMFTCDYSGQEVAVAAQVSKDPTLVESLNQGYDMHLAIANQFYNLGIPKEALEKTHPDYDKYKEEFGKKRSQAKTITFGLMYGKQAYGFAKDFGISEDEAQKIVDKYFEGMPKLKESIDNAHKEIDSNGHVRNLAGRYRHFTKNDWGRYDTGAYRQAYNFKIQGFSADMIRIACINTYARKRKHPEWDLKIIGTVHDEAIMMVKEEYKDEATKMVKEAFETAVRFVVPTPGDIEVGTNYGNAK